MALLRPQDADEIKKELEANLVNDVTITLVGPSALNPPAQDLTPQIRGLYEEVAALSPKLKFEYVEVPAGEDRARFGLEAGEGGPITIISGAGKGKVRYRGAPSGHEFPAFVGDLVSVSTGESGLSEESKKALATITKPVHIQVFFTPT